jgi:hypothetical protein
VSTVNTSDLRQFTGSLEMYRHPLFGMNYSQGIHYLMENGAAWLVEAIMSYKLNQKLQRQKWAEEYQFWNLKVDLTEHSAVLTCREDSNKKPFITQVFEYTDFPLPEIDIWVEGGVVILPSEH